MQKREALPLFHPSFIAVRPGDDARAQGHGQEARRSVHQRTAAAEEGKRYQQHTDEYREAAGQPVGAEAAQVQPANGFCCGWGIDVTRVADSEQQEAIAEAMQNLGDAAADPNTLAGALVADIAAEYQAKIEEDWQKFVLRGEPLPN